MKPNNNFIKSITSKDIKRYWTKVNKTNSCWEWTGSLSTSGYGHFSIKRKSVKAHRVSYYIEYGELSDTLVVCHTCDNRKCVNPAHLFEATQSANMRDMVNKGRGADYRGEKANGSKLTETDIRDIKTRLANGERNIDLAAEYNLNKDYVSQIKRGLRWEHIT